MSDGYLGNMLCVECDSNPIEPGCGALCKSCYALAIEQKRKASQQGNAPKQGGAVTVTTKSKSQSSNSSMPQPWVYVKNESEADTFLADHPDFEGTVICEDAL